MTVTKPLATPVRLERRLRNVDGRAAGVSRLGLAVLAVFYAA
jgi:hypothetical protein